MTTGDSASDLLGARRSATRRGFLKVGGAAALGAGAAALAACEPGGTSAASGSSTQPESMLDKWARTKRARLGVDLSFKPIQFRNDQGKPDGYTLNLTDIMMKDLGVTPEYVEVPFSQIFAAQAAGKFDMAGISAIILPSRAQKVLFAGFPHIYESTVVLLKANSRVSSKQQLNAADVVLSVQQGSAEEFTAKLLFPAASVRPFVAVQDEVNEVAAGRAEAAIISEFYVPDALKAHPDMRVLPGPPLLVDIDSYFMPLGDVKLWMWVTNWLRYEASHSVLAGLWDKWVGREAREKYNLPSSGVGPAGQPVQGV